MLVRQRVNFLYLLLLAGNLLPAFKLYLEGYPMLHSGFHNGFHYISTRQCASWDSWSQGPQNRQMLAYAEGKVPPQTQYRHACEQKKKLILRVAPAWRKEHTHTQHTSLPHSYTKVSREEDSAQVTWQPIHARLFFVQACCFCRLAGPTRHCIIGVDLLTYSPVFLFFSLFPASH